MTLPLDDDGPADFKRDQWGRPFIMQPDGTRKGYTRSSSAAKTIEDTYNLEKWARRNIAYGMAYDASLTARIIAIGGDPSTWTKTQKDAVNKILEDADAAAKAHKAADIGTAIHHLTHRLDRGETVTAGPYQADLDAYRQALLDRYFMTYPEYTECRMVNDLLEMAGTCDRILQWGDQWRVADIKTGTTIDFGGLGWAAQLAAYAGGHLYNPLSEQRQPTPTIDQTVGYIIHLPAGTGRCHIYEVDLVAGHRAAELANEIRHIRKASKQWITPTATHSPRASTTPSAATCSANSNDGSTTTAEQTPSTEPPNSSSKTPSDSKANQATTTTTPDWRFEAKRRYDTLNHQQQLDYTQRKKWIDTSDPAAVFALLDNVDPFIYVHKKIAPEPVTALPVPVQPPPPDEGEDVDEGDVAELETMFTGLGLEAQQWLSILVTEGRRHGHDWRIRNHPTQRRYELYRAALALAEWAYG